MSCRIDCCQAVPEPLRNIFCWKNSAVSSKYFLYMNVACYILNIVANDPVRSMLKCLITMVVINYFLISYLNISIFDLKKYLMVDEFKDFTKACSTILEASYKRLISIVKWERKFCSTRFCILSSFLVVLLAYVNLVKLIWVLLNLSFLIHPVAKYYFANLHRFAEPYLELIYYKFNDLLCCSAKK